MPNQSNLHLDSKSVLVWEYIKIRTILNIQSCYYSQAPAEPEAMVGCVVVQKEAIQNKTSAAYALPSEHIRGTSSAQEDNNIAYQSHPIKKYPIAAQFSDNDQFMDAIHHGMYRQLSDSRGNGYHILSMTGLFRR